MKKILALEKIPYILTILITLATFQLNNLISIQLETPTLSYHFKTIKNSEVSSEVVQKELECIVENVSNKKAYRNMTIDISFRFPLDTPRKVYKPEIISVAPSQTLGDSLWENIEQGERNRYVIPVMQPNTKYILNLTTLQSRNMKETPKLYFSSTDDICLVKYNFWIFLVQNQVMVNLFLMRLWLIGIVIYFRLILKKEIKL
jgi:hypothetical protein